MYSPLGLRLSHTRGSHSKGGEGIWPPSGLLLNSSPVSSASSSPAHPGGGGGPSSSSTSSSVVLLKPKPNLRTNRDRRGGIRRHRLLNDSTTSLLGGEDSDEEDSSEKDICVQVGGKGMSPELSMVLEKAVVLLKPDEFASLRVSICEYEEGTLSVQDFASELLSLLGDEEKSSFFTELRELVRLSDLSTWDRCIYSQRGRRAGKKKIMFQPWEHPRFLFKPESSRSEREHYGSPHSHPLKGPHSSLHVSRGLLGDPYEDEDFLPRGESIYRNPPSAFPSSCLSSSYSGFLGGGYRSRKDGLSHSSSLQRPPFTGDEASFPRRTHSASSSNNNRGWTYDLLDLEDCRLEVLRPPLRDPARCSYSNADNQIHIRIHKNSPTLGIAIEGGVNTQQPLPRIIAIQPNGAAYHTGSIKVGQLIKEVNGISLSGLPHETVARIIAECYAKRKEPFLTLLLKNQKPTPAEQRRSASLHAHR